MADLLASSTYISSALKRGQEVTGKVVLATPQEILVDIGAKSEGIIAGKELPLSKDEISKISIGDNIEAMVLYPENDAGQVVLTLRRLSGENRWKELESKMKDGDEVEVSVVEANRGGIICDFAGLRGFLPASQLLKAPTKLEDLIGKSFSVRVLEVDRASNRLIFSQKHPGKKDLDELLKLLAQIKISDKYSGVVSAILPFGIFVEINLKGITGSKGSTSTTSSEEKARDTSDTLDSRGTSKIEGLVHISEISWEKVDEVGRLFKVGDKVDVVVIAKDTTTGRLNLSLKQLQEDPFVKATEKYSKDQKVIGKVSRITPFGVFVTLEEGVEGLIHISKIPPNVSYKDGEKVECEIESVDIPSRKIALVPLVTEKPVLYR
ncbi:MAG: S1 RNA-binding domain-containing protein [Candidatus Curtissbacteria bacterium]|nr:S1 RNA-binding domain-containing protein [Candidatus Curtissbacteria bacterium]